MKKAGQIVGLTAAVGLIFGMQACRPEPCLYHRYQNFEQHSWHRQDSLRFHIEVEPHLLAKYQTESQAESQTALANQAGSQAEATDKVIAGSQAASQVALVYHFKLDQHSLRAYPYQQLMVAVESRMDSLQRVDTIDLMQIKNPALAVAWQLPKTESSYVVTLTHLMQEPSLPNLQRLGLKITLQ